MKTILCTGWLLLALVAYNQSNPLPYVKEGKWSLIDTTGKVLLETGYSYIHPYDEAGLTFFRSNGAYGILDNSGKEVLPAVWSDVRQNGRGRYALSNGNGWISFASDSKHHLVPSDTLESLELLSLSWILAGKKGNLSVQNLASGQRWEIDDTASYYKVIHDHLLFRVNDTTELLVDPDGKELLRGFVRMENQNELYHACRGKIHYLFDKQGSWNIPDISSVSFDWKGVFVKAGKLGAYYGYDRSVIISGDYDNIRWFDEKYFLGTRAGFVSLIDQQTRKTALPFKYEDIKSLGEQGYIVYQNGYTGMIDPQFREVIPCKYTRFVPSGDLVRVYDESYEGLFSLKTHREILPAVYNRISWNGLRFKAQRNELMLLIELNEAHAVTQKASIDNAITVRTALGVVNLKRRKQIDYRLFSLGWYLDSTLVTPKTGDPFYTLKWGLKNDQDSILIQPSIPNLIYLPSSPFSIQSLGERPFGQGEDSRNTKAMAYRFIYLPKGKILSKEVFLSYDSTDFIHRSFIRVCTEKNFGVLREDGNYSPLTYIEKGNNTYLRYCQSEKIDMAKTNRTDMTEVPAFNFDGRYLENPIKHQFGNQRYYGLIYPEGKWNYLTPEGTPLFKDTFSFAQPLLGRHAIVQKGKTWGVVTADTLIIQPIYNSVERRVVARDTFFLVQLARGGTRLLDTNLRLLPEHRIADNRGSSLIIEENGLRYLTDNTFRKLTEGFTTMKFLKNGLILAKMHKEFTLFDPEGTMLYSSPEPPEQVLFNEYPVVKNGATSDLLNTEGATLLTGFSSIETRGDFLLVKKEGEWSVYDHNVQLLADGITTTILVDSIGHHFCLEEKGRLSVYNENGERLARIKELKPDYFFSGRFIVSEKDSCFV